MYVTFWSVEEKLLVGSLVLLTLSCVLHCFIILFGSSKRKEEKNKLVPPTIVLCKICCVLILKLKPSQRNHFCRCFLPTRSCATDYCVYYNVMCFDIEAQASTEKSFLPPFSAHTVLCHRQNPASSGSSLKLLKGHTPPFTTESCHLY